LSTCTQKIGFYDTLKNPKPPDLIGTRLVLLKFEKKMLNLYLMTIHVFYLSNSTYECLVFCF